MMFAKPSLWVAAMFWLSLMPACYSSSATEQSAPDDGVVQEAPASILSLELKMFKPTVRMSEPADVQLTFRNNGDADIHFPVAPERPGAFFSFLLIGDHGSEVLVSGHSFGLFQQGYLEVKMVRLRPGEKHVVEITDAVPLRRFRWPTPLAGENIEVRAIYRDFTPLRKQLPEDRQGLTWRGMTMSSAATIQVVRTTGGEEIDVIETLLDTEEPKQMKSFIPTLISALEEDFASNVRHRSARVLGRFGEVAKDAAPALIRALEDENPTVRRAAAAALKKIDPDAAVAAGVE